MSRQRWGQYTSESLHDFAWPTDTTKSKSLSTIVQGLPVRGSDLYSWETRPETLWERHHKIGDVIPRKGVLDADKEVMKGQANCQLVYGKP